MAKSIPVSRLPGRWRIPAHTKHRVEWTTPDEPTIWLAVHYEERRDRLTTTHSSEGRRLGRHLGSVSDETPIAQHRDFVPASVRRQPLKLLGTGVGLRARIGKTQRSLQQ